MLKTTWRSIFIFICGMVATNELASASPLSARPKSPQFYAQAKPLVNKPIISKPSLGSQVVSPQKKLVEVNIQVELSKSPTTLPSSFNSGFPSNEAKLNVLGKPSSSWTTGGGLNPYGSGSIRF